MVCALPTKRTARVSALSARENSESFYRNNLPNQRGIIRDIHGEAVGEHIGLMYYTLGQRRGLGIGGRGSGERWYVVEKDLQRNELIVVQGEHPALYSQGLVAKEAEWIEGSAPSSSFECTVKYRYRQPDRKAKVTAQGNTFFVEFLNRKRRFVRDSMWYFMIKKFVWAEQK